MPLSKSQWRLIKSFQKRSKNLGSMSEARKVEIASMIGIGHLEWDGKRVRRTQTSLDAARLFDVIPAEVGRTVSNQRAREAGELGPDDYRRAKALLLKTGEISVGRGRGGTVVRETDVRSTSHLGGVKQESDLYEPLRSWLVDNLLLSDSAFGAVYVTASGQRQSRASGQWSVPDVVLLTVDDLPFLPDATVELQSFEVKKYKDAPNLRGVYEASAHQRRAHKAILVVEWPFDEDEKIPSKVDEECARLGVGLYQVWEGEVSLVREPIRQLVDPVDLSNYIAEIITEDDRKTYLTAIGKDRTGGPRPPSSCDVDLS